MYKKKAVGLLLYCLNSGRIFLMKRSKSTSFPGVWGCISGGIEQGESDLDTIAREMIEELGLDLIENIKDLDLIQTKENSSIIFKQYLGYVDEEFKPTEYFPNRENEIWSWVDLYNLPVPIYKDLIGIIQTLKHAIK